MNQHFPELSHSVSELQVIARRIHRHCMHYRGADHRRSTFQVINSVLPFGAMMVLLGVLATDHYWESLLLAIPAAGFLLRTLLFSMIAAMDHFWIHGRRTTDLVRCSAYSRLPLTTIGSVTMLPITQVVVIWIAVVKAILKR